MKVKFMSLASGSSGNCYYLATDTDVILIDAGIGIRTIKKVFKERGLDMGLIRLSSSLTIMLIISKLSDTWRANITFRYILHLKYIRASTGVTA